MQIVFEDIEKYIESYSSEEPELLRKLRRRTHVEVLYPRMLSGPYQGRLLAMISHLLRPERILEIGTFTGYSCICLAEGLAAGGKIVSLELIREREDFIRKWLKEAGIEEQVELIFGDAYDTLPNLSGEFDLIFLDANKARYLDYYHLVFPLLKKGGLILADNVLWDGKILSDTYTDKETLGIRAFNDFVAQDERVSKVLLPIRDGLYLIRKNT
ncbi:MAG: O-methyltransferase [Bacteroidia bacterium]|nr:O-methyltransferase [Bacteroidia bacterium]